MAPFWWDSLIREQRHLAFKQEHAVVRRSMSDVKEDRPVSQIVEST